MYDFTVLILRAAYPASVTVTLDMLTAAVTLAERQGSPAPRWRMFVVGAPRVALAHGLSIEAPPLPAQLAEDRSLWVVPGLGIDTPTALEARLACADAQAASAALARHVSQGGSVAASCSAVFLLHAAGLLAGRTATTTWWLAPALQRLAPRCTVDANRMVISDGPVTTAGAALAHTDLMLHLLRVRCGLALADAVARALLIDARSAQAPFIVPSVLASGDRLIAKLAQRIEHQLPHVPSIGELAAECCISERTLARHIRNATGGSPLALVQCVRLRVARMLLETSRLSVEQIAARVGYSDATALRRLMRKSTGATPRQFRATEFA